MRGVFSRYNNQPDKIGFWLLIAVITLGALWVGEFILKLPLETMRVAFGIGLPLIIGTSAIAVCYGLKKPHLSWIIVVLTIIGTVYCLYYGPPISSFADHPVH